MWYLRKNILRTYLTEYQLLEAEEEKKPKDQRLEKIIIEKGMLLQVDRKDNKLTVSDGEHFTYLNHKREQETLRRLSQSINSSATIDDVERSLFLFKNFTFGFDSDEKDELIVSVETDDFSCVAPNNFLEKHMRHKYITLTIGWREQHEYKKKAESLRKKAKYENGVRSKFAGFGTTMGLSMDDLMAVEHKDVDEGDAEGEMPVENVDDALLSAGDMMGVGTRHVVDSSAKKSKNRSGVVLDDDIPPNPLNEANSNDFGGIQKELDFVNDKELLFDLDQMVEEHGAPTKKVEAEKKDNPKKSKEKGNEQDQSGNQGNEINIIEEIKVKPQQEEDGDDEPIGRVVRPVDLAMIQEAQMEEVGESNVNDRRQEDHSSALFDYSLDTIARPRSPSNLVENPVRTQKKTIRQKQSAFDLEFDDGWLKLPERTGLVHRGSFFDDLTQLFNKCKPHRQILNFS